ncbi:MAG: (2Fe-2S)-binding protein [Gemmataceae bacterium]
MDRCTSESCSDCPERVVCRCFNVTESQLRDAIARHDLRTIREIKRRTGAGDGCTCCHAELNEVLTRVSLAMV